MTSHPNFLEQELIKEICPLKVEGYELPIHALEPRKKYKRIEHALPDKAELILKKNKKTIYKLTLKPVKPLRMGSDKTLRKKNPDKISFGVIAKYGDRLEACAYKNESSPNPTAIDDPIKANLEGFGKVNPITFFLFLNGEYIRLDKDDWRRFYRIMNKIGHFFGILGRKRAKNQRKYS